MLQCVHHFKDPCSCLDIIIDVLPKNGAVLFSQRASHKFPFPLTGEHYSWLQKTPCLLDKLLELLKSRKDVKLTEEVIDETFRISKQSYCNWTRNGFCSYFSNYTKQQLEDYVEQLKKEHFNGMEDGDDVVINDQITLVMCSKIC